MSPLSPSLFDFQKINPFSLFAGKNEWEPAYVCVCLCGCVSVCVCDFQCKGVKESSTYGSTPNITHTHKIHRFLHRNMKCTWLLLLIIYFILVASNQPNTFIIK